MDDETVAGPMGGHWHHSIAAPKHKQPIEVKAKKGDPAAISACLDAERAAQMTGHGGVSILPVVPPEEVDASAKSDTTIAFLDAEARKEEASKLEGALEEAQAAQGIADAAHEKVRLAAAETKEEAIKQDEAMSTLTLARSEQAIVDEEANENLAMKQAGDAVAHGAQTGLNSARAHKAAADKSVEDLTAVAENATADAGMQKSKMEHSYAMEVLQHHAVDAAVLAKKEATKAFQAATVTYDMAHATEARLAPIATGTAITAHAANEHLAVSQDKQFALKMQVDHGVDVSQEAVKEHMQEMKKAEQAKAELEMHAKLDELAQASATKKAAKKAAEDEEKAKEDADYAQIQKKAAAFQGKA
jgi:hypothetical protein